MKYLALCFFFAALAGAEERSFDRSLTVSGPVDLDARTASGGITVAAGSSSSLQIHVILRSGNGWSGTASADVRARMAEIERHPPIEQNGNHIRLGYDEDQNLTRNISIEFQVQTPVATELHAHAASGGIEVAGIQGPVDVETASGGIRVRDVQQEVHAGAASGGIRLEQINSGVTARAASGSIEASGIAGPINIEASSGGVRISQTKAAPIQARTASGSIQIKLAPGAGYQLSVDSASGSINVPAMAVRSSYSRHHMEGQIGGGGPAVDIHVASGSVTVE